MDQAGISLMDKTNKTDSPNAKESRGKGLYAVIGILLFGICASCAIWFSNFSGFILGSSDPVEEGAKIEYVRPGWKIEPLAKAPGEIFSLCTHHWQGNDDVYVGAGNSAEVFRFNTSDANDVRRIVTGFGEDAQNGTSVITHLSICNLFDDETPKLVATVNQCVPVGKPWLFVVSVAQPANLLAVVRPDIASSWTHGIGYSKDKHGRDTILSTYCGHGEVLEFAMIKSVLSDGYVADGLKYRKLGTMPGSGEYLQTIDIDGDSENELIIASGYRPQEACIRIYKRFSKASANVAKNAFGSKRLLGEDWILMREIKENNRFGNVRFLAGKSTPGERPSLIAWWCTDLLGGKCEVARYTFVNGTEIIPQLIAQGEAQDLWPIDGQMAVNDTDGDTMPEIWFATSGGCLWRAVLSDRPYVKSPPLSAGTEIPQRVLDKQSAVRIFPGVSEFDLISYSPTGFGPLASMPKTKGGTDLILGSGKTVFRVSAIQKSEPTATRTRPIMAARGFGRRINFPVAGKSNSKMTTSPKSPTPKAR